jgi:hypothetical protein
MVNSKVERAAGRLDSNLGILTSEVLRLEQAGVVAHHEMTIDFLD